MYVTYNWDCGCESADVVRCHVINVILNVTPETFVLGVTFNDGPHVVRPELTLRHNLTNTVCSLFLPQYSI